MKEMGKRIRQQRIEKEMTLEDLGHLVGVSKSTLSKWENGEVENIGRSKIQKLAEIFQVRASWLMGMDTAKEVKLTYTAPELEPVHLVVEGDPIIGESALRAKLYQAAVRVRAENLQAAIEVLESLS